MSDNAAITPGVGAALATHEVTNSGDTAHVQLTRRVITIGAEGSRTVVEVVDKSSRSDTYTTTANGTTVDVSGQAMVPSTIQVKGTGAAATAWSVVLEGSLDNVNWTTLGTHINTSESDGQTKAAASSVAVLYFRSRCVSVTLGGASAIVVTILAVPYGSGGGSSSAGTSAAVSLHHRILTNSTNAVNIKASAAVLWGVAGFNGHDYAIQICFHNTAGTPTAGASIVRKYVAAAGQHFNFPIPGGGVAFATGLGMSVVYSTTGVLTDTVATALDATDKACVEVAYV